MKKEEINKLKSDIMKIYPRLKAYSISLTRDKTFAEEVLHDVIIKMLEKPDKFVSYNSLISVAIISIKNRYIDLIRKKSPNQFNEISNNIEFLKESNSSVSRADRDKILNETIWGQTILDPDKKSMVDLIYSKCLSLLDRISLDIFQMNLIDTRLMTTSKIAKILKISQSKVLKILAAAKGTMIDCINKG